MYTFTCYIMKAIFSPQSGCHLVVLWMFYYKKCVKPMNKIVKHSVIVFLMGAIIMKIDYPPFCWGPSWTSSRTPGLPGPHSEIHWSNWCSRLLDDWLEKMLKISPSSLRCEPKPGWRHEEEIPLTNNSEVTSQPPGRIHQ